MKNYLISCIVTMLLISCEEKREISSIHPNNWETRKADIKAKDSLETGMSYLSIYSEIYSLSEHKTHDLTATVSLRNTNLSDTIFITKAEYYDTSGKLIRTYFDDPIFLKPMETVEIVIDEKDRTGGTGANFIFEWKIDQGIHEPLFEGVMISTSGQQGLSFTTHSKRIE